jgi:hypothetical protein
MPGVYGGLIIILAYATLETTQSLWLITQNGEDILTSSNQQIIVRD